MAEERIYLSSVSIPLPDEFRQGLETLQRQIAELNYSIRPVQAMFPPHISLLYLNPITSRDLDRVIANLTQKKTGLPKIQVTIRGLGEFQRRVGFISLLAHPETDILGISTQLAVGLDRFVKSGIKKAPHLQVSSCWFAHTRRDVVSRWSEISDICEPVNWTFPFDKLMVSGKPLGPRGLVDLSRVVYI